MTADDDDDDDGGDADDTTDTREAMRMRSVSVLGLSEITWPEFRARHQHGGRYSHTQAGSSFPAVP